MFHRVSNGYTVLSGSERKPLVNAHAVGPVDPDEQIEISVYLKVSDADELRQEARQGSLLSREEYRNRYSASLDDIKKIERFAANHHLLVGEKNPVTGKVVLAGSVAALCHAFETALYQYETPGGKYRGRTGPIHIPHELDGIVTGVFGLDDRPQAHPHFKRQQPEAHEETSAQSYTVQTVTELYNFPTNLTGKGQCIALIELGGGYNPGDLKSFFQNRNVSITPVSVDGGQNSPTGDPNGADGEVTLDIEIAGSVAPDANIAVYFAPNTDRGFLDAITQAIHDTTNNPSIISISWGSAEENWTKQARNAMNQAFQTAAKLGITVLASAGDAGSSDGVNDGKAHVDFPASSPYVTGCGGTTLQEADGKITSETAWNELPVDEGATGGGVSDFFPLPAWQASAHVPPPHKAQGGRGVPDVAGNADPQTGYQMYVDEQNTVVGGTSAVAPLWAGLIALINEQQRQPVGYLNPILYQDYNQNNAFNDITEGNNGAYRAGPGWDPCTGLGSPNGVKLLQMLQSSSNRSLATSNI